MLNLYYMEQSTRERMISAAIDLFHQQGVNATSIDQILEKSGTGKSQFSHYFKNKEGLVHSCLVYLDEAIRKGLTPTGYDIRTWKDLDSWFQQYIDFQKTVDFERSCPIGTIGNDISSDQDLPRQDIKLFLEWSRGQLSRFFTEKKALGEMSLVTRPEELADLCIAVMQGGMLLTKIKRNPDMFQNAATQTLQYIKSLRVSKTGRER